ncbi:acylphosphatase [Nibricoccus sp. IMCC34717]|uniref:acylphosphatase n=1 Tax=Nibricoccus sp. IMCC34717 TaxID=3034021 RepID=UPI00384DA170
MAKVHHEIIHYTGHVQGVGFRYAVQQVAKEYEVAGFVQNLTDGRVVVEVEGEAAEVREFAKAVEERMHGYIRKTERKAEARERAFQGFGIR